MMDMKSMVGALATMPDDQRKAMMQERLSMFAEMTEDQRRAAMAQMMEAAAGLPDDKLRKILKTRTELLLAFPTDKRNTLMETHMALMQGMPPERAMREMKIIESIVPELPLLQQQMLKMMLENMTKMMVPSGTPSPGGTVGMPGMNMADIVRALAAMPEAQRKTMMQERLAMFAEMGDAERRQAMRQMIEAVNGLPQADVRKLVKTRTEILAGFPVRTRETLMKTHMAVLQALPKEAMMAEMQLVQSIIPELLPSDRQVMEDAMKMMPMPAMAGTASMTGRTVEQRAATPQATPARLAGWGVLLLWIGGVAAGVWLLISPFILGFSGGGAATINNVILGIGIGVLALIVAVARPAAESAWGNALVWIVGLAGIWVIISPFALGFANGGVANWNNVILGIIVAVLVGVVALVRPSETG
jgi:uncharacterized protein YbjQ (UPF0145 family)